MKSFGSQLKNANRLLSASIGNRLILLVPIKLRVLALTPVACSITSYVQGLPVCRSLRAISSFSANFTAIPPNVLLLSFYQKFNLCQRCIFVLPGNYTRKRLTYFLEYGKIALSKMKSSRPGGCTPKAALSNNRKSLPLCLRNILPFHPLPGKNQLLPWNYSYQPINQPKAHSPALVATAGWMKPKIITPVLSAVTG